MTTEPDDRVARASAELDEGPDASAEAASVDTADHAALVAAMAAVRDRVRDVPRPDPAARERALAAALAVFDEQSTGAPAPGATVHRLGPPRSTRRPRSTRWLVPAAAALVAVVALGGIAGRFGGDRSDDLAGDAALSVDQPVATVLAEPLEAAVSADPDLADRAEVMAEAEGPPAAGAADAESADAAAALPVIARDADVVELVVAALADAAPSTRVCDHGIEATALDARTSPERVVVIAVETGADGAEAVLLAAPGDADACREIGRVPLP